MAKINLSRMLLGGLLAGLVINTGEFVLNGVILAAEWEAVRTSLGLGAFDPAQMAASVVITFLYGIVLIWIYAAIRPRFGPGPKTAVIAGLTLWVLSYVLFISTLQAGGMVTTTLTITTIIWGVFEAPLAAIAGAWVYREGEA